MWIFLSKVGQVEIELDRLEPASAGPVRLALAPLSVRSDDVFCCHKTTNRSIYERIAREHPNADDVQLTVCEPEPLPARTSNTPATTPQPRPPGSHELDDWFQGVSVVVGDE